MFKGPTKEVVNVLDGWGNLWECSQTFYHTNIKAEIAMNIIRIRRFFCRKMSKSNYNVRITKCHQNSYIERFCIFYTSLYYFLQEILMTATFNNWKGYYPFSSLDLLRAFVGLTFEEICSFSVSSKKLRKLILNCSYTRPQS